MLVAEQLSRQQRLCFSLSFHRFQCRVRYVLFVLTKADAPGQRIAHVFPVKALVGARAASDALFFFFFFFLSQMLLPPLRDLVRVRHAARRLLSLESQEQDP